MQSGDKVCSWLPRPKAGKIKPAASARKTEWHRVSIFNQNLVGIAERYLKKGSKVYIEGQLETRKYTDKDGVVQYSTDVVLTRFKGELNPARWPRWR